MYTVSGHAAMIHDARRVEAYRKAIQSVVKPDAVVVDIGTGLGIFAFLACQAGARKIYAIEASPIIEVARRLAACNGYSERIEFIEDISTRVALPEKADVIVSDLSGAIPLFQQHLTSIADARKRLLKPDGALIPRSDTLWAGVVDAADVHQKLAPPADRALGLDMRLAWSISTNENFNQHFAKEQIMTAAQPVATLDYTAIDDPNIRAQVEWRAARSGRAHGISMWFERVLADGVSFATAPGEPDMVYGGLFFPWPEAVELSKGDAVEWNFRADLVGENYIFTWETNVSTGPQVKRRFRQSNFFAEPHSPNRLRKQSGAHKPKLNENGEIDRFILQLMDGNRNIEAIAREALQRFPARFPTIEGALGYTAKLSRKYSL